MDLSGIGLDLDAEQEGIWHTYPNTDLKFRIARLGHPEYARATRKLARKQKTHLRNVELNEKEARNFLAPAVAQFIIMDWENFEEPGEKKGELKQIKYTAKRAEEFLRDPRFPHIYTWILEMAGDAECYQKLQVDEAAKNS